MQIISVDPNLGNQFNQSVGDKVNKSGNFTITATQRRIDFTFIYFLLVTSLYVNLNVPISITDCINFIIAFGGVVLCFLAYDALKEYYTFTIGIKNNHQLITIGPYKYIMHPGYVGQLLVLINTIIFFNIGWIVTIGLIVYTLFRYRERIICEERMLSDHFGDNFDTYKSTRMRFIPFVI